MYGILSRSLLSNYEFVVYLGILSASPALVSRPALQLDHPGDSGREPFLANIRTSGSDSLRAHDEIPGSDARLYGGNDMRDPKKGESESSREKV